MKYQVMVFIMISLKDFMVCIVHIGGLGVCFGKIRITDQGEVIQQKYGYEPLAKYNLCSYIGAVTEATLNPPPVPKNNWRRLIEKMSILEVQPRTVLGGAAS